MIVDAAGKTALPFVTHALAPLNEGELEDTLCTKVEMNPSAGPASWPQSWSTGMKTLHASRTVTFQDRWTVLFVDGIRVQVLLPTVQPPSSYLLRQYKEVLISFVR